MPYRRATDFWDIQMLGHRFVYEEEHAIFRDTARRFALREIAPNFERWEQAGIVDRDYWERGGGGGVVFAPTTGGGGGPRGGFRAHPNRLPGGLGGGFFLAAP